MIDETEAPIELEAERRLNVNARYLSGRWPRQDGTVYGRLQQEKNGHDQRSRKPPPARR